MPRKDVLAAHLSHPQLGELRLKDDRRTYGGSTAWAGHDIVLELPLLREDDLVDMAATCSRLREEQPRLAAEVAAFIQADLAQPGGVLAPWVGNDSEAYLAQLAPAKLIVLYGGSFHLYLKSAVDPRYWVIVQAHIDEGCLELNVRGDGFVDARMPLLLDGLAHAVESAQLEIIIGTTQWDNDRQAVRYAPEPHVMYMLTVTVDAHSGEDGAPAPTVQALPVSEACNGRHPLPQEMPGIVLQSTDDWEAWLGNDAPELQDNELRFTSWRDGRLGIRWTARYYAYTRHLPFLFEGEIEFKGVSLQAEQESDADGLVDRSLGEHYRRQLRRVVERRPEQPDEWFSIRYGL